MSDIHNIGLWIGFSIFLVVALFIDAIVMRNPHARPNESLKAAVLWSVVWVISALIFCAILWFVLLNSAGPLIAHEKALNFLAGYLIEKSLSVDNLFVFFLIFNQLKIPQSLQQRVFSYGIWGAIVFRLILIVTGSYLLNRFHWLLYVMGAFLLFTGVKMFFASEHENDLQSNSVFKFLQKHLRVTHEFQEEHFFVRKNKVWFATPLFIALILIEFSDLVFAFDSIPAIFAVTTDPFIVWTSNIFAILGLRALYFLLAGVVNRLQFLKFGIALILVFVGVKLIISPWIHIPVSVSLIFILTVLTLFTWVSIRKLRREAQQGIKND